MYTTYFTVNGHLAGCITFEFEYDHTCDLDEINQLEQACLIATRAKRTALQGHSWKARTVDCNGNVVAEFDHRYMNP